MGKYKVRLDFFKLVKREIRIMLKNFSMIYSFSTFFLIASLIFIFSVNDISYVKIFYKSIVWIVLIFSIMLVSENFLNEDFNDGSLKELQFLGFSEENIIVSKSIAMWVMIMIPMLFLVPLVFVFFQITLYELISLVINLFLATPSLTLISILSSLFSVQLKRNKIIQFVIILPFFVPMIIFTTSTGTLFESYNLNENQFLILIGIFFITLPVCLLAGKLIMREINK